MLRQHDENTFPSPLPSSRPLFTRSNSDDSAHSSSSTTLSSRPTSATSKRPQTDGNKLHSAPSSNAPLAELSTSTRPAGTLRRTSSQYSLAIAENGKAQMKVVEAPLFASPPKTTILQMKKPQLPSLATAIQSPMLPSMCSSPSVMSDTSQKTLPPTTAHLTSKSSLSLACAPLTSTSLSASSITNFSRVYSLPSLSSFSSTASVRSNSTSSIFAGGLRHGSPPKEALYSASSDNTNPQTELWENLDSDPLEPEDEVLANHKKRLMDSPVRRNSIRMEDILSSSRKRKVTGLSEMTASNKKFRTVFGKDMPARAPPQQRSNVASNTRIEQIMPPEASHAASLDKPSLGDINKPSAPDPTSHSLDQRGVARKRGYSRSMLSRSVSLDRIIAHDDSTDEDVSPAKPGPRSAGLYENHAFLGRPPLARASTHLGVLPRPSIEASARSPMSIEHATQVTRTDRTDTQGLDESEEDASGDEDMATKSNVVARLSNLPTSKLDDDTEEPDMTFSTEASQSFDGLSRGDISEVETEVEISFRSNSQQMGVDTISTRPLAIQSQPPATSTPSRRRTLEDTLAIAARKGHITSPIKHGSPAKNGKILTEVERDCAAVLVGLGFPDVF